MNDVRHTGKWTGVVTTTRVTHATPASVYAHTAERGWEVDRAVPEGDRDACPDIAKQLIHDSLNSQIRVSVLFHADTNQCFALQLYTVRWVN